MINYTSKTILKFVLVAAWLLLQGASTLAHAEDSRELLAGSQELLRFPKEVERVAVNNEEVLSFELISGKEVLVRSKTRGRTNLLVWFQDGTLQNIAYVIGSLANETARVMEETIQRLDGGIGAKVRVSRVVRNVVLSENNKTTVIDGPTGERSISTVTDAERKPTEQDDLYILEGTVPNQVALAKVLSVSASIIRAKQPEFKVVTDEGGGLLQNLGQQNLARQASSELSERGPRGHQNGSGLGNRVANNFGRASVISGAEGQLLSLLEVKEIPRVRIGIKLLEIDRDKLQEYDSKLRVTIADFEPPAPAFEVVRPFASSTRDTVLLPLPGSVQNTLDAVSGALTNQVQLALDRVSLDATFTLLQTEGIARTLAQPSLSVLSGESASILVGGEIPLQYSTSTSVVVTQTIQFERFGVELEVRALVGDDGTITLDLAPSVSEPVVNILSGVDAPAFEVKSLNTSARVLDGQALFIGGLIQREDSFRRRKTPGAADLPLLGWLFRKVESTNSEKELVILVTPVVEHDALPESTLWKFPEIDIKDI